MENQIKKHREHLGLSQQQLATSVGVSRSKLRRIEVEGQEPPPDLAEHISQALGLKLRDIFPDYPKIKVTRVKHLKPKHDSMFDLTEYDLWSDA